MSPQIRWKGKTAGSRHAGRRRDRIRALNIWGGGTEPSVTYEQHPNARLRTPRQGCVRRTQVSWGAFGPECPGLQELWAAARTWSWPKNQCQHCQREKDISDGGSPGLAAVLSQRAVGLLVVSGTSRPCAQATLKSQRRQPDWTRTVHDSSHRLLAEISLGES